MRLQQYLNESIIKIDQRDIKLLYKPFVKYMRGIQQNVKTKNSSALKKNLESIRKNGFHAKAGSVEMWILKSFKSSNLKSKAARDAHKINPIDIHVGFPTDEPFYSPELKTIIVGLPLANLDPLTDPKVVKEIDDAELYHFFENFSTEIQVKQLIRHELTHWMDDSLRNLHLTKKASKGQIKSRDEDVVEYYEIEAIITQVDQLKKMLGVERYENLTWKHFAKFTPDIQHNLENQPGFLKKFMKRMNREGLFTDKMRTTFKK